MESAIGSVFQSGSYILLVVMVSASLFFAVTALRELGDELLEGLLYGALGVFFFCVHLYLLKNIPEGSLLGRQAKDLDFWGWLLWIMAPGLIGMFMLRSAVSFCIGCRKPGLFKLFFGLTLLCYLYQVGGGWAPDVKGIIILMWAIVFFNLELRTTYD